MLDALIDGFGLAQQALFEGVVQPVMFALGLGGRLEEGFVATGWLLVGLVQLAVIALGFGLLERWRPVEPVLDRPAVRTDVVYTLIHRLGLVRLALFFTLDPLWQAVSAWLGLHGLRPLSFEGLWPGVTDVAWVAFLLYLLLFDLVDYALHRAQHGWDWWWQLHALHHSQRQMTLWSDNRNHFLDDVLVDSLLVVAAQLIGVAPEQFMALIALSQLSESLQHANVRMPCAPLIERLWITPRFHRVHHGVESGEHNYGVLLPWWDMLFGTARFDLGAGPTGLMDQITQRRDYGQGLWSQQWLGLKRFVRRA